MLTGRVPFSSPNVLQIFEAIAEGFYVIPGHVSAAAAHLIRGMMCKNPQVSELATQLLVISGPLLFLVEYSVYSFLLSSISQVNDGLLALLISLLEKSHPLHSVGQQLLVCAIL